MASDYVTLDEFKVTAELVGFNFADYDAQRALTSASRGVDEYTSRFFYTLGTAMLYEYGSGRCLELDDFTSVSTLSVDYDRDGVFETTWTSSEYAIKPFNAAVTGKPYETIELLPRAAVRIPYYVPALVRVDGTFGWPAVPEPIKEATTILAMRLLRRARDAPFGVVGFGADLTVVRISRADSDVAFLLDPYLKHKGALAA